MKRRATTGGKARQARSRKVPNPKPHAARAVPRRRRSLDSNLQSELEQRTRELAEARSQLAEALEQQTATSEVLKVISGSPGDLQSVFETMLASATKLCEASYGAMWLWDSRGMRAAALHGALPEPFLERWRDRVVFRPSPDIPGVRAMIERRPIQVTDLREEPAYIAGDPLPVAAVEDAGIRTMVCVPMLKDDQSIGHITIYRREVLSFSDKQIALLANFAAQAVIAIENARLLNELRQRTDDLTEALEQQTATSEVLKVISSSPGELEPVFNAMLENAAQICQAKFGTLMLREGDGFRIMAIRGDLPPEYLEERRHRPLLPIMPGTGLARAISSKAPVQIADVQAEPAYQTEPGRAFTEIAGARTVLTVPMLKENELIGIISIYRREVRLFGDKQIELLQNFAAQAVIAIENARLLNELRQRTDDLSEALEQQTATSDVLKVISSSPGELEPVFNAMLESATRICGAQLGNLLLYEGSAFRYVAMHGAPPAFAELRRRDPIIRPRPGAILDQIIKTKTAAHVVDVVAEKRSDSKEIVELAGARSIILVPMLKEDELIGAIGIYRQEVRPFTDKQIELVSNFAAQAVIAIENTRLLNELRQRTAELTESLEQQTATSEVLQVISSSPGELQPVFQAMLENATRICNAKFANLLLFDGDVFRMTAMHGASAEWAAFRSSNPVVPPTGKNPLARVVRTKQLLHIVDTWEDPGYIDREPSFVPMVEIAGARSILAVPMLKENELIGVFNIYNQEVRPFTDKQIELVQNFAAQAVIAIENTRLLNELRESLQRQTATSQVLGVISSSPGELEPVFEAILANATRICEANFGNLFLYEGGAFRIVALHSAPPAWAERWQRESVLSIPDTSEIPLARLARTNEVVHISDLRVEQSYVERDFPIVALIELAGARTYLAVPMLKEDKLLGAIAIYRQEVRPFTDKQIELVTNFAAQAVIAIENTRLLNELRESLAQQTATADVLKIISRSTFDLKTVLNTLVESAARLSDSDFATLNRQHADGYRQVASYGLTSDTVQTIEAKPLSAGRGSVVGRTLIERRPVQIVDVLADPDFKMADISKRTGANTILGVPLLREGEPIGVMTLQRRAKEPYTDKQIELLATFADQAVIAIENVRLFESVEARTRELAQSLEDLQTAQDRLVQTQKLASLGQLTAGIAHEIKNPLNFVNNFSSLSTELLDELQDTLKGVSLPDKTRAEIDEITETLRANLDKIEQHGKRADSIVKNMLLHSREGSGEHRPVDVNALVEESLNLAYHGARAEKQGFNVTLERSLDPAAGSVDVFPQEITRVLLNLISNGFYAATKRKAEVGDGYEPTLSAATKDLGDRVEVRIRDNGTGIPPEVKDKMFNPFFTTKPPGEGTGLGLSLSHDIIVKQHAGSIEVDTEPGQYTEFRIILPRTAATLAKSGGRA